MSEKPWWQSKTVIANILTLLISLLAFTAGSDLIAEYPRVAASLMFAVGLLNIVLRFITDTSISLK